MIKKKVRYEVWCDTCKNLIFAMDTNRVSDVNREMKKYKWRIEGKELTCPVCINDEKKRQEEEQRKMEEERAKEEEKSKFCPKCGCRLATVMESGAKIGVYCAECKEERLDA